MAEPNKTGADDHDRLIDLAHLSSAVAHYLINAYSATVSNSELIRSPISRSSDPKEPAALATSMIETALHAAGIARKLIDLSRKQGALELLDPDGEPRTVDLNQLIAELVEDEKREASPGIEWRLNAGAIPPIPGDRSQLRKMLARFVENARQALPAGSGTIEFSTQTDSRGWVIMTIRDSGCGMSAGRPAAGRRAVLHDQARPLRRRLDDRTAHLAHASRSPFHRELPRRRNHRPPVDPALCEPFGTVAETSGVIVIIDYGMGNLRSVQKAIEAVGSSAEITSDPARLAQAAKVVLPGVGAFSDAMAELRRIGPRRGILRGRSVGKAMPGRVPRVAAPLRQSHEDGEHEGLGLLPGRVERFAARPRLKIPHMGWNTLQVLKPVPLLAGLGPEISVYFVHSYHAVPANREHVAAEAEYPDPFPAIVWHENLMACQFHPEKSQSVGLAMYANFVALN